MNHVIPKHRPISGPRRIACPWCKSFLRYSIVDREKLDLNYYVKCPVCNKYIKEDKA